MNDLRLRLREVLEVAPPSAHAPLGELLVSGGKIDANDLVHALQLQRSIDAPLGDILVSEGLASKADVLRALAVQAHAEGADLELEPSAPQVAKRLPVTLCLKHGVVPWKEDARALYVAISSPYGFTALRADLGPTRKPLFPVIVDEVQIRRQLSLLYGQELAEKAARRVPAAESCRGWESAQAARTRWGALAAIAFVVLTLCAPALMFSALAVVATLTLLMTTVLRLAALAAHFSPGSLPPWVARLSPRPLLRRLRRRPQTRQKEPELVLLSGSRATTALGLASAARSFGKSLPSINGGEQRFRLPRVSMLVPLHREREIATQLIERLSRLTYPKSLLEVILVLEESDSLTRKTIAKTTLPPWMRVVEVPAAGDLTTKPRALNYALDFCRGSIIGVWDAEDCPEPDQIEKVVTRFQKAPPETACLQGVLDYYNSRTNWLTRCFTIEYATWWRVFLPGIARLGLVVPLGGTTLFFRRKALEALGGWDAHNVTEDADLGLRLARHGYVTELLSTVTHEEATSRPWSWVRQRSRWLKGFLITYLVHMRAPRALWRDLGPWRFFGVQTLFLATILQFTLAPVLWSFWLLLLGVGHPGLEILGPGTIRAMVGLFIFSEVLSLCAGAVAISDPARRHLLPFLPTMGVYFTLGTLAVYKGLWELIRAPFYWDKTQHGVSPRTDRTL